MPRYHFHLHEAAVTLPDAEGLELADPASAHRHAIAQARDLMSHELRQNGEIDLRWSIEIVGEDGQRLECLPFEQAVRVMPNPST